MMVCTRHARTISRWLLTAVGIWGFALGPAVAHNDIAKASRTAPSAQPACVHPDNATRTGIVRVLAGEDAHGSGVVLNTNLVLTAAHVLSEADPVRVAVSDDRYHFARVVAVDQQHDLALLVTRTDGARPVPVAERQLAGDEPVWAAGYPLALDLTVSQGKYQHRVRTKLYTSAWITSGTSGGGLLRCTRGRYQLAGMLRDYVAEVRNGKYINISQSVSTSAHRIRKFVTDHGYFLPRGD